MSIRSRGAWICPVLVIWIALISLGVESQGGKQFSLNFRNEKPIQAAASGATGNGATGPYARTEMKHKNGGPRAKEFLVTFKRDEDSLALVGALPGTEPQRFVHERVVEHLNSQENLPKDFSFDSLDMVSIISLKNPNESILKDIREFPEVDEVIEIGAGKAWTLRLISNY